MFSQFVRLLGKNVTHPTCYQVGDKNEILQEFEKILLPLVAFKQKSERKFFTLSWYLPEDLPKKGKQYYFAIS